MLKVIEEKRVNAERTERVVRDENGFYIRQMKLDGNDDWWSYYISSCPLSIDDENKNINGGKQNDKN